METRAIPSGERKTILVVDDHLLVRQLVAGVLDHVHGYNVLMAETGERGLQQSREFKGEIHLLLTDYQMPGMSGIELATAMTIDRPKLKVMIMSAYPQGIVIPNGEWHFLLKPFIASQLRTLVAGLVSPDAKSGFIVPALPE